MYDNFTFCMDYIITLLGGKSFVVPFTALEEQQRVHKGKIDNIKPVGMPEQMPSAVDIDSMKLKELQVYALENDIDPELWQGVKNVMKLRKIIKENG